MTYPPFTRDDIAVTKRIVVPEFSTLITLSGTFGVSFPETINSSFLLCIFIPNALHASIVAIVSLERRGLIIRDSPFAKEETNIALWV